MGKRHRHGYSSSHLGRLWAVTKRSALIRSQTDHKLCAVFREQCETYGQVPVVWGSSSGPKSLMCTPSAADWLQAGCRFKGKEVTARGGRKRNEGSACVCGATPFRT